MEDTEQIDMQYLKLYFIGLPGVGKTTFRKRLTRSLVNISSLLPEDRERETEYYSTHLAECIQTLCILQDEEKFDLEISENLDDELKAFFKYLLGMTERKEPAPTDSDSTQAVHSESPLDSNTSQKLASTKGSSTQLDSSPVGESNETTEPTEKDETKSKLSVCWQRSEKLLLLETIQTLFQGTRFCSILLMSVDSLDFLRCFRLYVVVLEYFLFSSR